MCALALVCWCASRVSRANGDELAVGDEAEPPPSLSLALARCLSVSREVNRCVDFAHAVACAPRARGRAATALARDADGRLVVASLSARRRACVLAMVAVRFARSRARCSGRG